MLDGRLVVFVEAAREPASPTAHPFALFFSYSWVLAVYVLQTGPSIADGSVPIQTSAESVPSTPCWFGEGALIVKHLRQNGVLAKSSEEVRFARRRFGHDEVIDVLAVLFGSAMSGERTLEAYDERLTPWAQPFLALCERDQFPARSTLSRLLAALTMEPVEALRSLFLDELLARPLNKEGQRGELLDRGGGQWEVFDSDGTREAARQRALPQTEDLPRPLAGWARSALLVPGDASVGTSCGRARSSARLIVSSGSAPLAIEAMVALGRNCGRASRPSGVLSLRTNSRASAACFGSMDNMAWGPCLQTWLASPS